jgi:hypothetical protein
MTVASGQAARSRTVLPRRAGLLAFVVADVSLIDWNRTRLGAI